MWLGKAPASKEPNGANNNLPCGSRDTAEENKATTNNDTTTTKVEMHVMEVNAETNETPEANGGPGDTNTESAVWT